MSLGDAAAKLRLPVFACSANKRPIVETGFKAAVTDAQAIRAMFARPGAELIGVPTGEVSGLVVIDIDIRDDRSGMGWLNENADALPETRTHKTRTGGLHLVFLYPAGHDIRNSAGKLAPGVDVRANGGYVIVPPSPGYQVADETAPAEMPLWLIRACCKPEPVAQPVGPRPASRLDGGTRYGLSALERECDAIRTAGPGTKHHALNKAAYSIGGLVAAGELDRGAAMSDLRCSLDAIKASCEDFGAAERTLADAFQAGERAPRQPPPDRATYHAEPEPPPDEDESYYAAMHAHYEAEHDRAEPQPDAPQPDEPTGDEKPPFPVIFFQDVQPSIDAADFVEGLLISTAMSVVYGPSNSGKTFFVSNLALHVASGIPWNGREVDHGGVLWLAMEGAHGIANRIAAWKADTGYESGAIHFAYVPVALDLLRPDSDTRPLIQTIKIVAARMGVPIKLVVIDTLSRAIAGGNENSPEDMGALVTNGTLIQQATKAHVLWIHHTGKDEAKGARGHSLLRAATDTEIEISASEDGQRSARVTKQREMECAGDFPFTLKTVELGINRRNKPVTSCVVEHENLNRPKPNASISNRLTGHQKRAFDILNDLIAEHGTRDSRGVPASCLSVPDQWWREKFYQRAMVAEDQTTKQKAFKRASEQLINARVVGLNASRVWICQWQPGHPAASTPDKTDKNP